MIAVCLVLQWWHLNNNIAPSGCNLCGMLRSTIMSPLRAMMIAVCLVLQWMAPLQNVASSRPWWLPFTLALLWCHLYNNIVISWPQFFPNVKTTVMSLLRGFWLIWVVDSRKYRQFEVAINCLILSWIKRDTKNASLFIHLFSFYLLLTVSKQTVILAIEKIDKQSNYHPCSSGQ